MHYEIFFPSVWEMPIQLPSSKSISNRVLIINALANGNAKLLDLADCDDVHAMTKGLEANDWEAVDIMAAGTAMRFLTAYFSVTPGCHYITGTERMKQRPIWALVDALRRLGADIDYVERDGYPPLEINGKKLSGDKIALQGDISSQYVSALLMIAPTLEHGLSLFLIGKITSRPYIDMTIKLMKEFGAKVDWASENCIVVKPKPYKRSKAYTVEADWSAASYWYEACALGKAGREYELLKLKENSLQGDKRVADIFRKLCISTYYTPNGVTIRKERGRPIRFLEEDLRDVPDLAQTLVVTCGILNVSFRFTGLESLRIKETDRIHALTVEMKKFGVDLETEDGALVWNGRRRRNVPLYPEVNTYDDHRMAMAFAPIGIKYGGFVKINDPMVVTKSYPHYWDHLKAIGATIKELE